MARRIVPGTTYMITRRCTERMFLLGANDRSSETFAYCLAEAASRYGVLVHAAVVMSNHLHIIVTDVRGVLPRFSQLFCKSSLFPVVRPSSFAATTDA